MRKFIQVVLLIIVLFSTSCSKPKVNDNEDIENISKELLTDYFITSTEIIKKMDDELTKLNQKIIDMQIQIDELNIKINEQQ